MIPYGKQEITQSDIDSVIEVLKSDFLTQGPIVPIFENHIKNYCGSKYAIASNSATSSLHSACHALGVSKGDIVWTSANTFVASSNCAIYCGATVDFIDIDPRSFNICLNKLESKLILAKKNGNLPKVLIPVHLTGQSCDMKKIYELSLTYNFKIIEDASHSIGSKYLDRYVGSCDYSDITIFSFHPVKIITTGEGGIATTNDKNLAEKLNLFRSHGVTRDSKLMKKHSDGPWYYEQIDIGYNYRMTELQAALGISQLERIESIITKRHLIANEYNKKLKNLPLRLPLQDNKSYSSYHLYVIRLNLDQIEISHKDFFIKMRDEDILINLHYIPVYLHPYYKKLGFKEGHCPEAEKYYGDAISIPMFPSLTAKEQDKVINTIKSILK
jgi:UDP-4-amino-4,6-dideoxy-N-acetyl-beta-L-altrosamine transaminase